MGNVAEKNDWMNDIIITKHFVERYNERILKIDTSKNIRLEELKREIYKDLNNRLTDREKECVQLLIANKGTIKIPIAGINQLIMLNKILITVY